MVSGGWTGDACQQRGNWLGEDPASRGRTVMGYLRQWSTAGETGNKERTSAPGLFCRDVISVTEGKWKKQVIVSIKMAAITNYQQQRFAERRQGARPRT